jgi:hypothetical protein
MGMLNEKNESFVEGVLEGGEYLSNMINEIIDLSITYEKNSLQFKFDTGKDKGVYYELEYTKQKF